MASGGRRIASIGKHWRDKGWGNGVYENGCRFTFRLNWVITREFEESTSSLFINGISDVALKTLVQVENLLISAALSITEIVAITVVNCILQNAFVPSVDEVCMVSVAGGVTV